VHDILRLRTDVFVVEQRCIYPEVDGADPGAVHVRALTPEGALVAYARILPPGPDGMPHIGRVVVHPAHRGLGIAHELMRRTLAAAAAHFGDGPVALAAQGHLEGFYAAHGFRRTSPDYDLDGIPHVDMVRPRAAT
jgi:ElaA protein